MVLIRPANLQIYHKINNEYNTFWKVILFKKSTDILYVFNKIIFFFILNMLKANYIHRI